MQTQFHTPSGILLRVPMLDDIPAVVTMLNASWKATFGAPGFADDQLRADWTAPGMVLANDCRLATTLDDTIVGVASIYFRAPFVRNHIFCRVHPAWEECGIGTALITWCEQRIRQRSNEAPPNTRITIGANVLATHASAIQLLTDQGYQHSRTFHSMRIVMETPPVAPVWPAGIQVRSMIPNQEEAAVYRVFQETFRDHWGHVETPFEEGFPRWLNFIQNRESYDPSLFFLALDQGEIVGFALCLPSIREDPDMGWVDDLGVQRAGRKRGLGLALLQHAFSEFYQRGVRKVGLGVDASSLTGALRLYEKAGMEVWRQRYTFEKEVRTGRDLSTQGVG